MRIVLIRFIGVLSLLAFSGCVHNIEEFQTTQTTKSKIIKSILSDSNISSPGNTSLITAQVQNDSPLLSKPKIAKITIEPYIDSDGDYHEALKVHIRIQESKFIDNKKYFSINEE